MNNYCNLCAEEIYGLSPEKDTCINCYEWLITTETQLLKEENLFPPAYTTYPPVYADGTLNDVSKYISTNTTNTLSDTEKIIDKEKIVEFLFKVYTEELETIDFPIFSKDEEIILLKCLLQITINNNIGLKEDLKKQEIQYSTTVYELLMDTFKHPPVVVTINKN